MADEPEPALARVALGGDFVPAAVVRVAVAGDVGRRRVQPKVRGGEGQVEEERPAGEIGRASCRERVYSNV